MKKWIIFCLLASVLFIGCPFVAIYEIPHQRQLQIDQKDRIRQLVENCMSQASIPVIRQTMPESKVSGATFLAYPKEEYARNWLDAYDLTPDS